MNPLTEHETEKRNGTGCDRPLTRVFRVALLILSVAMIAAGLYRNDFREVLSKAVMICMECIGIG
ncbi:MAG: hypothetical protein K6F53_09645 [Lachnospiraceae bacterium]|nr:hypothetical protein [Lachnospiraceae bacterium]